MKSGWHHKNYQARPPTVDVIHSLGSRLPVQPHVPLLGRTRQRPHPNDGTMERRAEDRLGECPDFVDSLT
jgi:hypothetical protein